MHATRHARPDFLRALTDSAVSPIPATPEGLARAASLLRAGECVALPTETVYGLAADALDPAAAAKVFAIKGRPLIDPLIVHVPDLAALARVAEPDPRLEKLAVLWPGPLTVVLRRRREVPDVVTAGLDTVAVRIPAHPVFREVLRLSGLALAAPSANPFGYVSPTRAAHVTDSLGARCPWVVDGGPCEHGLESTIVDLSAPGAARLLRPGPIPLERLRGLLGEVAVTGRSADQSSAQAAPGMLDRHYSPATRLRLFPAGGSPGAVGPREAVMFVRRRPGTDGPGVFHLSESGTVEEAAHNLFDLLRRLDARGHALIHAELAEPAGVGAAFNDRLARAAAR
jgi:L-threonylcarbamoyladenylate synthase